ncbi:putative tRNA(His) guanylyltransferase [Nymphon striatum]|nr:putative tRNA(His) guanylyltransferase [Nymphon striatum]
MAQSKYEYVKNNETDEICLPNCWIVIRVYRKNYERFTEDHTFQKPNDISALNLMNQCGSKVMSDFKDVLLAYGQHHEYNFVFRRKTQEYKRRASKLVTYICSLFTSSYVFFWNKHFPGVKLQYPPAFNANIAVYPDIEDLQSYLSFRQNECNEINLYNVVLWNLVHKDKITIPEAREKMKDLTILDKVEILSTNFDTNYYNEAEIYRKGTVLLRKKVPEKIMCDVNNKHSKETIRNVSKILTEHYDMNENKFWSDNPQLNAIVDDVMDNRNRPIRGWHSDILCACLPPSGQPASLNISDSKELVIHKATLAKALAPAGTAGLEALNLYIGKGQKPMDKPGGPLVIGGEHD